MLNINHDYKSPNYANEIIKPEYVVLHCMCMTDTQALEFLCAEENGVSAHYYIGRDGQVYNLVDDNKKAWHAGNSHWKDIEHLNPHSIGIELGNDGELKEGEWGGELAYNDAQYESLILLLKDIQKRYDIKNDNIIAHSDIAPERKTDPGMYFDWAKLNQAGFDTDFKCTTTDCKQALADFGYNLNYDINAVTASFQRRFLPHNITGVFDEVTKDFIKSKVQS
tara:strand:+ start:3241 stop:3909 length:669 start_codon:yes stop_codon:yes gene_type:complete